MIVLLRDPSHVHGTTEYLPTQVNAKLSRSTECKSVPREVCGPEACPVVRGDRICRDGGASLGDYWIHYLI